MPRPRNALVLPVDRCTPTPWHAVMTWKAPDTLRMDASTRHFHPTHARAGVSQRATHAPGHLRNGAPLALITSARGTMLPGHQYIMKSILLDEPDRSNVTRQQREKPKRLNPATGRTRSETDGRPGGSMLDPGPACSWSVWGRGSGRVGVPRSPGSVFAELAIEARVGMIYTWSD
ncbi:hypothetical protein B2J93_9241 [Marssonina coronariae]|uniref:Uncharacterized protein n=1 Tax=Diplocarpon coronariae TaxID=2795749 RepID=A0A218ZEQ0_9HELO|nr:hypothetical protein B2J93_9241 [Marssonina coronariae]